MLKGSNYTHLDSNNLKIVALKVVVGKTTEDQTKFNISTQNDSRLIRSCFIFYLEFCKTSNQNSYGSFFNSQFIKVVGKATIASEHSPTTQPTTSSSIASLSATSAAMMSAAAATASSEVAVASAFQSVTADHETISNPLQIFPDMQAISEGIIGPLPKDHSPKVSSSIKFSIRG